MRTPRVIWQHPGMENDCVFHFEMYLYELFDIFMNIKRSFYIFGVTKL